MEEIGEAKTYISSQRISAAIRGNEAFVLGLAMGLFVVAASLIF